MKNTLSTLTKMALGLIFAAITFSPVQADVIQNPDELAYTHYRCDALAQLNRLTDADVIVCDELKSTTGFDLAAWEADNRDASIKSREEVFLDFF